MFLGSKPPLRGMKIKGSSRASSAGNLYQWKEALGNTGQPESSCWNAKGRRKKDVILLLQASTATHLSIISRESMNI